MYNWSLYVDIVIVNSKYLYLHTICVSKVITKDPEVASGSYLT